MSSGTNWMGGRGHVKKARRVSGLKILERGGNAEQHFAKLRAITSNFATQDQPHGGAGSKATSLVSFKHAQADSRGSMVGHEATATQDDRIHSTTSIHPRVLDKPNKPVKQNRLTELVDTAVRNIESLDTKRAHINSIDARTLVGLDITSRKRKHGMAFDGQDQVTSKPFYYPSEAKPRAFATSPSPEPPIVVDTCAERIEDMLSFGTPSDRPSANGSQTQISIIHSDEVQDEQTTGRSQTFTDVPLVSTTPIEPQSNTIEIDIPPTLYEDSVRAAARILKLQDALLGVQTSRTLAPWHSEDDSEIRAFNLFMPVQADDLDRIPLDTEPKAIITFQAERNPQNRPPDALDKENRPNIGNQVRGSLRRDQQDPNRQAENNKAPHLPVNPHGKSRMETPIGTNPPILSPLAPRKLIGKTQNNSRIGLMPSSPLDGHIPRSHDTHPQHTSDQETLSSGHSDIHGKMDDRESIMTTDSALRPDSSSVTWYFASAESSPSPSLAAGDDNNRTIGLKLFDDHP